MGTLFKVDEDRLNVKRKRNARNTKTMEYNCGGYALGTYTWYLPYDREPISREDFFNDNFNDNDDDMPPRDQKIWDLLEEGMSTEEVENILLHDDVEYMLKDFNGRLRIVDSPLDVEDDTTVVAYRIGIAVDEEIEDVWQDFHFLVRKDGHWSEKRGGAKIYDAEFEPEESDDEPWYTDAGWYDSPIVFMTLDAEE